MQSDQIIENMRLAFVLDVLAVVRKQETFEKAVSAVCDIFTEHLQCSQVCLGWNRGSEIELEAISGKPEFDRSMEIIRVMQNAMEEALISQEEIAVSPDTKKVPQNHRLLQGMSAYFYSLTMPFGNRENLLGAIILQRQDKEFSEQEILTVRLSLENIIPILEILYKQKEGIFVSLIKFFTQLGDNFFKVKNGAAILSGLLAVITMAAFFLVKIEYRLSCSFIIRSEHQAVVSARSDGYIRSVNKKEGDHVKADDLLIQLDSSEDSVRKMELAAELEKYVDQEKIYRSEQKYGEMMIATASARYTEARIKRVENRIDKASIKAPVSGCIIEDRDLYQKVNLPVRSGDELMIISDLNNLFAEIHFPEESFTLYKKNMRAHLRFISRPDLDFPVKIDTISPAAISRKGNNLFLLKADFKSPIQWCRPGMTGQCYLETGKKTLCWIVFYRIADWLRMNLWW